ncbi:MAG: glycosyltransferase family 2 protein [Coprobacillus cateniformis]
MKDNHTWVICAYGESDYLEACIQSLKNQTLQSQIICYSSTPLDSIKELCQRYAIPFYTKQGGGIGKDWNNAISFVETKYATIAHQDDYYEPRYVEKVLAKMEKTSDVLIGYSDYFEEKNGLKIPANTNLKIKTLMLKTMNLFPGSHFWRNRVMAFGNPICCPAVTYNLEKLKNFYFDEGMKVSLDWYAWYKISEYRSFCYVSETHVPPCSGGLLSKPLQTIRSKRRSMHVYSSGPKWIAKLLMRQYVKSQHSNN